MWMWMGARSLAHLSSEEVELCFAIIAFVAAAAAARKCALGVVGERRNSN